MGELRQTDNADLDPQDLFNASFQPVIGRSPSPSASQSQGTLEGVIQLFRQKTDGEIAVLIPGTTPAKAAEIRAMLQAAGLL